jgi:hypothetical protein
MRAHSLNSTAVGDRQLGWILAEDVRSAEGKRLFRKGSRIDRPVLEQWSEVAPATLHLIEPEPDDLHEDEAGRRIAEAVGGEGLRIKGPIQSRYNLIADRKGLLRVNAAVLREVNRVAGATVFSLLDRQTVVDGKVVAGVKVTPITLPKQRVEEIEQICAQAEQPPMVVLPFAHKQVFVVATEGLNAKMRARFEEMVARKINWYGSEVIGVQFVDAEPAAVAEAFQQGLSRGANILMAAGGNTIDPLDPIFLALDEIDAEMVHFGAPAHPGSMFWLAEVGDVPIFNLASCSMYSKATVADLILPLVMTGQRVVSDDIVELGYGGLLEREMAFRFPDYDAESSDEGDDTSEE